MAKKIISVGFKLASDQVFFSDFHEKNSLLDWDVILFRPNTDRFISMSSSYSGHEYYNGKIVLNDTQSFRAKEACEHWRRELQEAVDSGKIVIVHLNCPDVVYAATGTTSTSGTGRNQKVTRHVDELSSYASLPIRLTPTVTQGTEMVVRPEYQALLASYWARFGAQSDYEVVFPKDTKGCCISTKNGGRPVGICMNSRTSAGSILLLPDLDFEKDDFFVEVDGKEVFSDAAEQFASTYLTEVLGLERMLRESSEKTPQPDWANSENYALSNEVKLREKLLLAEAELENAQKNKEIAENLLLDAGQIRDLLFERGKPLEAAILNALRLLGFNATGYEDENSEFDAVFESAEGRLLGEAEGRDNKPIAIGKLRQLSTNIHEDLQREDVLEPAKGILFGNAFRFTRPHERDESLTEKCKILANSMSIGLVSTAELFRVVQYISNFEDDEFAKKCREILVASSGQIVFPDTPVHSGKVLPSSEVAK